MTFSLFFPQNTHARLTNRAMKGQILNLLHFFAKFLINSAIAFYIEKKLTDFDPHIGDTLCQIRACMVLENYTLLFLNHFKEILNEIKTLESIEIEIAQTIIKFNTLIKENHSNYHKELDKNESIEEFFNTHGINFSITPELIFLAKARILTLFSKIDIQGVSRGIDYDKFYKEAKITKTFAKKIMHSYQQDIAKLSCEFIFNIARKKYHSNENVLLLHYLLRVDNDSRSILPAYEVTKMLLHYIHQNNFSILIELEKANFNNQSNSKNTEAFIFVPTVDSVNFELLSEDKLWSVNMPCLIIKGIINEFYFDKNQFLSDVQSLGLYKIILMNMAKHPQYPDMKTTTMSHNPYLIISESSTKLAQNLLYVIKSAESEFLHMKKLAEEYGCCLDNPSFFLIKHIFCDIMSNQLSKITFAACSKKQFRNSYQNTVNQIDIYPS